MDKLNVLAKMLKMLDNLYAEASDNGERAAVSFVEDIVDGWYYAEQERLKREGWKRESWQRLVVGKRREASWRDRSFWGGRGGASGRQ